MKFIPKGWQPATDELANKTILVTGAGDGIGKAAALAYAEHGAEVLLLGRTESKLNAVYDEIQKRGGVEPSIIHIDLGNVAYATLCTLADDLSSKIGHLDGLLHNASILGELKPLTQSDPTVWHQVMQINVNAPFMLTRTLFPLLNAAPRASIVFTSSGVGRVGRAYWGAYAVSKFATEGMMQVLADELGTTTKIRSNSFNPGAMNTAMRRSACPAEPPTDNPDPATLMDRWIYLMSDVSAHLNNLALSV